MWKKLNSHSWWLFEGRLRQCKNVLPDELNWLCYFAGSSKSHCKNSISFTLLESPHQVDMKNVVKSSLFAVFQYSRNSHCILSKKTIYFLFLNEITLWILVSSILVSLQHLLPLFKLKGKQNFSKTVILWYVGQLG